MANIELNGPSLPAGLIAKLRTFLGISNIDSRVEAIEDLIEENGGVGGGGSAETIPRFASVAALNASAPPANNSIAIVNGDSLGGEDPAFYQYTSAEGVWLGFQDESLRTTIYGTGGSQARLAAAETLAATHTSQIGTHTTQIGSLNSDTTNLKSRVQTLEDNPVSSEPYLGSSDRPTEGNGTALVARPLTVPEGFVWTHRDWREQLAVMLDGDVLVTRVAPKPTSVQLTRIDATTVQVSFPGVPGIEKVEVFADAETRDPPTLPNGDTTYADSYTVVYGDLITLGAGLVAYNFDSAEADPTFARVRLLPAGIGRDPQQQADSIVELRSDFSDEATLAAGAGVPAAVVAVTGATTVTTGESEVYAFSVTGGDGTGGGGAVLQAQWAFTITDEEGATYAASGTPDVTYVVAFAAGNRSGTITLAFPDNALATVSATFTPATVSADTDSLVVTIESASAGGGATDSLVDLVFTGSAGTTSSVANLGSLGGNLVTSAPVTLDGSGLAAFGDGVNGILGSSTLASTVGLDYGYNACALYVRVKFAGGGNGLAAMGGEAANLFSGLFSGYYADTLTSRAGGTIAGDPVTFANPEEVEILMTVTGTEVEYGSDLNLYLRRSGESGWTLFKSTEEIAGNAVSDGPFSVNGHPNLSSGDRIGKWFRRVTFWRMLTGDVQVTSANVDALLGI